MTTRTRLGCVALVAYPFVELTIAIIAASYIGWWWALVAVVACLVVGLGIVRYALSATGASLSAAFAPLRDNGTTAIGSSAGPAAPPAQTLLIAPAGLLIAVPGLLTTLIGCVLWLPVLRRRLALRWEAAARRAMPPQGDPWPPTADGA